MIGVSDLAAVLQSATCLSLLAIVLLTFWAEARLDAFRQELRELGYVEGQTIAIEYRFTEGNPDRLRALAADLVQRTPDVLWTPSPPAAQAIKQATTGSEEKHLASHQPVLRAISMLYQ